MQSINDLDRQIQTLQDKANSYSEMAQRERQKAEEAQENDDVATAKRHLDAATHYDQLAYASQGQIEDAQLKKHQDQKIINDLNEKRARLVEAHEQELRRIDLEIEKASGQ